MSAKAGDAIRIDWSNVAARPSHLPDDLAANLEAMIADGTLAKGARIPGERELAASMGVSRASVRSALRDLELKGLVDRRPGRGTIITNSERLREAGSLLGSLDSGQRDVLEVMDLRATIEPPIAARAAARATAADIRRLRAILGVAENTTAVKDVARLDEDFHRQISRATHNPLLERLLETTTTWMGPSRRTTVQTRRRVAASLAAHREVVEAIAAHDPDAAAAAMARHIQQVNAVLADAANLPGNVGPARVSARRSGAVRR
ncbi:MAG: GntR domain protein [Solirubrobacterales bacterium]|nr:GntR domain protein [Solirubrobacterales bacterium]